MDDVEWGRIDAMGENKDGDRRKTSPRRLRLLLHRERIVCSRPVLVSIFM